MSEGKYFDSNGNPCNLYRLINLEPEWACSRIREGEKAIEENKGLKDLLKKVRPIVYEDASTPENWKLQIAKALKESLS